MSTGFHVRADLYAAQKRRRQGGRSSIGPDMKSPGDRECLRDGMCGIKGRIWQQRERACPSDVFVRKAVLAQIGLQVRGEVLPGGEFVEVGVAGHSTPLFLNDADGDVGAVVPHPFKIGQQVVQDKAQLNGAGPGLETGDVPRPDLLNKAVNGLLQRLDELGARGVGCGETVQRGLQNILQGGDQNLQLLLGGGGEAEIPVADLPGGIQ